jgi:hypothetical protein
MKDTDGTDPASEDGGRTERRGREVMSDRAQGRQTTVSASFAQREEQMSGRHF